MKAAPLSVLTFAFGAPSCVPSSFLFSSVKRLATAAPRGENKINLRNFYNASNERDRKRFKGATKHVRFLTALLLFTLMSASPLDAEAQTAQMPAAAGVPRELARRRAAH